MSDTQAEDRRAQIQARLTEGADALHAYGRTLYDNHYEQIVMTMREAEAELARFSRVEQALLELSGRLTDLMGRTACYGPSDALREVVDRIALVLSASPEAQPEEGR